MQLEVLQGIQGLQLDARGMAAAGSGSGGGTFSVTVRGQYRLSISLPGAAAAGSCGEAGGSAVDDVGGLTCSLKAEVLPSFASGGRSPSTEAMLPLIGERAPAGSLILMVTLMTWGSENSVS